MTELTLPVIGIMKSPYKEKFGIPRQPNLVNVESYIEMSAPFNEISAFDGINEFSHLWLVWQFHENKNQDKQTFRPQVRPPRLGGNQKIGVFATRSMYRPAPIGLSVVQLKEVRKIGKSVRVYVTGSDLLDGTPIIDIKPYIQYSDAIPNAISGYAQEQPISKKVVWDDSVINQFQKWINQGVIKAQHLNELEEILALDPRPTYQNDPSRVYGLNFANMNVKFKVDEDIHVIKLEYFNA